MYNKPKNLTATISAVSPKTGGVKFEGQKDWYSRTTKCYGFSDKAKAGDQVEYSLDEEGKVSFMKVTSSSPNTEKLSESKKEDGNKIMRACNAINNATNLAVAMINAGQKIGDAKIFIAENSQNMYELQEKITKDKPIETPVTHEEYIEEEQ